MEDISAQGNVWVLESAMLAMNSLSCIVPIAITPCVKIMVARVFGATKSAVWDVQGSNIEYGLFVRVYPNTPFSTN